MGKSSANGANFPWLCYITIKKSVSTRSRFPSPSRPPFGNGLFKTNDAFVDDEKCCYPHDIRSVGPQFVNAKLVNITPISLWFMVLI